MFHGLRKSAVVFLLEAGCTDAEVAAITGQSRQMIEHYSRQVNQKKLAARAILKWETAASDGWGKVNDPFKFCNWPPKRACGVKGTTSQVALAPWLLCLLLTCCV